MAIQMLQMLISSICIVYIQLVYIGLVVLCYFLNLLYIFHLYCISLFICIVDQIQYFICDIYFLYALYPRSFIVLFVTKDSIGLMQYSIERHDMFRMVYMRPSPESLKSTSHLLVISLKNMSTNCTDT